MLTGTAWRIGRVFGIKIRIDTSWLIIFALVLVTLSGQYFPHVRPARSVPLHWFLGIITTILFFSSVLAHELAHSLVAIRQGESVRSITLFLFGGVAEITKEPDEPAKEFVMAIAGPVTSVALGGVFLLIWWLTRGVWLSAAAVSGWLMQMNFVLAVFNLVPGYPLDGGRILRSIIWKLTGDIGKATRAASRVGQVFAILLMGLGVYILVDSFRQGEGSLGGIWLVMIGWFLHSAAVRGYEQVRMREILSRTRVEQVMSRNLPWVPLALTLQSLIHDYVLAGLGRAFLVGDGAVLEGIVCLSDVKKVETRRWSRTPVGEVMMPSEKLLLANPRDSLEQVLGRMAARGCAQVPVVEGNRVIGLISRQEIVDLFKTKPEVDM
ncbi:MAG: site-2 protease family protein [Candidatus Eisenbacteria sp.]|nr:site-2 protease family protein [Candidatus Eisenbacteria bacterium]